MPTRMGWRGNIPDVTARTTTWFSCVAHGRNTHIGQRRHVRKQTHRRCCWIRLKRYSDNLETIYTAPPCKSRIPPSTSVLACQRASRYHGEKIVIVFLLQHGKKAIGEAKQVRARAYQTDLHDQQDRILPGANAAIGSRLPGLPCVMLLPFLAANFAQGPESSFLAWAYSFPPQIQWRRTPSMAAARLDLLPPSR